MLNEHLDRVLTESRAIFNKVRLSIKIPAIHWWYMTGSHCAEATAGFNNFVDYDGYRDIINILTLSVCCI